MSKNKNIIIGLITGLAAFHFPVSIATAEVSSPPIPINSPEAKKLLAPYERLVRENPAEAARIRMLAIHQKLTRDIRKTDIEQFARQIHRPETAQLALIEYYREEQRREKLEAAKPKSKQPEELEPYDKLSSEDKKAVSLAVYRQYQQLHASGIVGSIHGADAEKEFKKYLDPRIPYTNKSGKGNWPAMIEIMHAITLRKLGYKLEPGKSLSEREKLIDDLMRTRNPLETDIPIKIPEDLPEVFRVRYDANRMASHSFDIDKRYEEHKAEFIGEFLGLNTGKPNQWIKGRDIDRVNQWIINVRNNIARYSLDGAKSFYETTQGGVVDTTIANGGNDWCKSTEEKTGLPEYFKKPNQVMRCERVYVAHDVLPTLVLRDRPDISVVMDIQPDNKCPTVIPIKIQSSNKNDFRDESILGKVIAWAQTTVSTTCRYSTGIKLIGIVNDQIIYQGMAARANRWALSEIGGEESIFPAHINWSATLNPITPTDELLRLGEQYTYGKGVSRDDKKAVELFHSAAEKGNSEAQYKLAVMLEQGRGISQDFQSAFDWYSKAAKQGNAGAKNNIGVMYEKGLGVPKDLKEAFNRYREASWGGLGLGHYNLGNAYFKGSGVMRDARSARVYFRQAEELGVSDATEKLKEVETTLQGMTRP